MRMTFGEILKIEDLGNHSRMTMIRLGFLLASTVNVTPDSKRKGLYEVEGDSTVYYIHVSPVTGIISLIATWKDVVRAAPQLDVASVQQS